MGCFSSKEEEYTEPRDFAENDSTANESNNTFIAKRDPESDAAAPAKPFVDADAAVEDGEGSGEAGTSTAPDNRPPTKPQDGDDSSIDDDNNNNNSNNNNNNNNSNGNNDEKPQEQGIASTLLSELKPEVNLGPQIDAAPKVELNLGLGGDGDGEEAEEGAEEQAKSFMQLSGCFGMCGSG